MHRGVWFKDGHSEKSIIENETRKTFFTLQLSLLLLPPLLKNMFCAYLWSHSIWSLLRQGWCLQRLGSKFWLPLLGIWRIHCPKGITQPLQKTLRLWEWSCTCLSLETPWEAGLPQRGVITEDFLKELGSEPHLERFWLWEIFFLALLHGLWDLNFHIRDQTCTRYTGSSKL